MLSIFVERHLTRYDFGCTYFTNITVERDLTSHGYVGRHSNTTSQTDEGSADGRTSRGTVFGRATTQEVHVNVGLLYYL